MASKRSHDLVVLGTTLVLAGSVAALGAGPAPAAKKAFLERKTIYVSFEITETGTKEFGAGTPKDALTDTAFRRSRSAKFELPLDMPLPGANPTSSMPLTPADMAEEERFTGWAAAPDDAAVERQLTTGKIELSNTSLFLPVEFAIDEVEKYRHRDGPSDGWGPTATSTSKGRGIAYTMKTGMLLCDLKKMTCDLDSAIVSFQDGDDKVMVTSTSEMQGSEATRETVGPSLYLPKLPPDLAKRLIGFPITLPEPITLTFSGPSGDTASGLGTTVTVKMTLAATSGRAQAAR